MLCQVSSKVEETTVQDRILMIIAIVERNYLPSEASVTCCVIPANSLCVRDGLCEREPLRLIRRRVGKMLTSAADMAAKPQNP
jgi:hypothetical protein